MIETKSQAKRRVRDARIIEIWSDKWKGDKGTKTLLCENIADVCDTSLSTVTRVIKEFFISGTTGETVDL